MIRTMLDIIDIINLHGAEISEQASEGDALAREVLQYFNQWASSHTPDHASQALTKVKLEEWLHRKGTP